MSDSNAVAIITSFNYDSFIAESIESVLMQESVDEIIVVDDGSEDRSRSIIKEYKNRVRLLCQANSGQAAAINAGVSASSAEYIFFLDADDRWAPRKVRQCLSLFGERSDVEYIHHPARIVDSSGEVISHEGVRGLSEGRITRKQVLEGDAVMAPTSCICINRRLWGEVGPIPVSEFRIRADLFLQVEAATRTTVGVVGSRLTDYRIHGTNAFSGQFTVDEMEREVDRIRGVAWIRGGSEPSVDLNRNFYYARGQVIRLRRAGKFMRAIRLVCAYSWAEVRRASSNLGLSVGRCVIVCSCLVWPELGRVIQNLLRRLRWK